ncbi:MAG TPA: hypothetical protein VEX36_11310 [Thermoleophilaceae bacterium]|nr:hypothetical protein [Thermoleophilaceae bacterium]
MTGAGAIGAVGDVETPEPRLEAGAWQPAPLELVVCEPLEDEAHRSAAQKTDAQLVDLYEIALGAHAKAVEGGEGREGEADYWDVLQRAIVEEAARRPDFGQELAGEDQGSRRQRRLLRKRLEALLAAREAKLAGPTDGAVVEDPPADRSGTR